MPIAPKPSLLCCSQCSWKQIFAPAGDVLRKMPPKQCPQCGANVLHKDLPAPKVLQGLWRMMSSY